MAKLYDKEGNEYNVPFQIDIDEWLKTGDYSLEKPNVDATKEKPKKA